MGVERGGAVLAPLYKTMTHLEAATELLSQHTYRMTMPERSACETILAGNACEESDRIMRGLQTEFATQLAKAAPIEPVAQRESSDDEGGSLL